MTLRSMWVLTGSNSHHNRIAYFGRSNNRPSTLTEESIQKKKKAEKSLFLFTAQQIEKSESGPSFKGVQIRENDRSQKQKKNYGSQPLVVFLLSNW